MPTELSSEKLSNMDIHRFLSGMPRWSSAYYNHFSNFSKIISPVLEPISNEINTVDSQQNSFFECDEFGYPEYLYSAPIFGIPTSVTTEHGLGKYIGEKGAASIEASRIDLITQGDEVIIDEFSLTQIMFISSPVIFDIPLFIYIKSDSSILDVNTVKIYGYNEDNIYIEETISLSSNIYHMSMSKYKVITEILSDKYIDITTVVNLSEDLLVHKEGLLQKRLTNRAGEYITPYFTVDDNNLYLNNGSSLGKNEEYKFSLDRVPEKIFINNLLDIIFLSEGSLYSSKLVLDYVDISQNNSSLNVNDFIIVDDENTSVGDVCYISIKTKKILAEYINCQQIRVSATNNSITMYLNEEHDLVNERDTWINLTTFNDLRFGIQIDNTLPYTINVELDVYSNEFSAMSYTNVLESTHISVDIEDINDLVLFNNMLLMQIGDSGKYYKIDPVRLAYMSHSNREIITFNKFDTLDISYE